MSLLTRSEVKAFLRMTASTYDTLIDTYIPLIEEDICTYLNDWFDDKVIFIETGSGLAFSRGNTATATTQADYITDDNQDFSTAGFDDGMDVVIFGGSNYGLYTISSVTTAVMKVDTTGVFVDQDQDDSYNMVGTIRIARQNWPAWLKPIAAKMIWYQVNKNKPDGVQSERIDDYSVTFVNDRQYPMELLHGLSKMRVVKAH